MKTLLTLCLTCLYFLLASQTLSLQHLTKKITFDDESTFVLYLDKVRDCKNCKKIVGQLVEMNEDSLTMKLREFKQTIDSETKPLENIYISNTPNYKFTFHKSEISQIQVFPSYKKMKRIDNKRVIGGLFVLSGLVTSLSSFAFQDREIRQSIVELGFGKIAIGCLFASLGNRKRYRTKGANAVWRVN